MTAISDLAGWLTAELTVGAAGGGSATALAAWLWVKKRVGQPLTSALEKLEKVEYLIDGQPAIIDPLTSRELQAPKPGIAVQVGRLAEALLGEAGVVSRVMTLTDEVSSLKATAAGMDERLALLEAERKPAA